MASESDEQPRAERARAPGAPVLRLLLVDDHSFYRAGLRSMLADQGLDVAEARSGAAAIDLIATTPPDVVLMDLHMPGMSGIDATRRLRETSAVPVVMLTVSADDRDVVEAVRAGARGYLLKDAPLEEIVAGARAAATGDAWISPRVTGALLEHARESGAAPLDEPVALSDREYAVLRLIAAGMDNAAIGRELTSARGP